MIITITSNTICDLLSMPVRVCPVSREPDEILFCEFGHHVPVEWNYE